jgi:hypothetical protein
VRASRLAWTLAILAGLTFATGLGFSIAADRVRTATTGFGAGIVIGSAVVGGLVASRHPRNAIGWLFCGIAMAGSLMVVSREVAESWLDGSGVPAAIGETAAWYGDVSWIPAILPAATVLLLLFPDGRLPSRRWRAVAWCAGLGIALLFVTDSLSPGPLDDYPGLANPYGVDSPVREAAMGISSLLLIVAMVGSPLSLLLRFGRSGIEQRQQIKWLALAGAAAAATFAVALVGYDVWGGTVSNSAIMLSIALLPVAAGVAILRHRLYDIDVVINRTLVYGALTAVLGAAYLGSVLLLQLALSPVTESSDLAIAGSTLAVAALFRPARSRVQTLVDRRFYRRRYDAQRTLESFAVRLRDEVALEALSVELRAVVADTMQPAHVSLWLRRETERP